MIEALAGTWWPPKWGDGQRRGYPLEEQLQEMVLAPQTVIISAGTCLYASSPYNLQLHHRAKQGRYHGSKCSNVQPVQSLVLLLVVMCEKRES